MVALPYIAGLTPSLQSCINTIPHPVFDFLSNSWRRICAFISSKMFKYDYVTLTPEQVEIRRKLLDRAGFEAYLAPIAILAGVYLYRQINRSSTTSALGPRASKKPTTLQIFSRRVKWLLNSSPFPEYGPLHVQIFGGIYASYLLYLIFRSTGNDYMHVTKAFGHVAISQLPLYYLASFKSPKSPVTLATGLTHERLNGWHRFFGRLIWIMLATHAFLYLRFFIKLDLMPKRIKDVDVRLGLLSFWTATFLDWGRLPTIRKKFYHKIFYRSHIVLSALLLALVWFHVPYTRIYVGQAALLWLVYGFIGRANYSESATVTSKSVAKELLEVNVRVKDGTSWDAWLPGMHGYLNQAGLGPKAPFTVVGVTKSNTGPAESTVQLVARDLGGPTTGLLRSAAQSQAEIVMTLEGPYGEAKQYMPGLLKAGQDAGKILLVAGGVGITYALPIYASLLKARKDTAGLSLVWLTRDIDEAQWGIKELGELQQSVDARIYITNQTKDGNASHAEHRVDGLRILAEGGRPDLSLIVDSAFDAKPQSDQRWNRATKTSYEQVTVMVCGPSGLSNSLRSEVGRHVMGYGRQVIWYEEQFGFGGS